MGNIKDILNRADSAVVLLSDLKKVIQFLSNKITSSNTNITTLQTDLDTAEAAIVVAEAAIVTIEADIVTLQNDVVAAEGDIVQLQTDLDAAELAITTAEGNITTLQNAVTALETANLYQGVETLIGSIDFGAGAVPLYRRTIATTAPNPASNTLADLSGSFTADYISRVVNALLLYPEGTTNVTVNYQAVIRPQAIIYDVTANILSDNLGAGGTYLPATGEAIHVIIEYTKI